MPDWTPRCDRCGRFVDADALIVSAFIPPPREGMEDYIYCPRCAPTPAPAEPTRDFPAAGAPNEGTDNA